MGTLDSDWQKLNPEKNCYRLYSIRLEMDLFGPYRVCCKWGRMGGTKMRQLIRVYGSFAEAEQCIAQEVARRLKKGYALVGK